MEIGQKYWTRIRDLYQFSLVLLVYKSKKRTDPDFKSLIGEPTRIHPDLKHWNSVLIDGIEYRNFFFFVNCGKSWGGVHKDYKMIFDVIQFLVLISRLVCKSSNVCTNLHVHNFFVGQYWQFTFTGQEFYCNLNFQA